MERPDYRTLQALDAVIRERGFERAAQKLCITQSAVSQRIKQLEICSGSRCWCVPYRRARRNEGKTAGTAAPGGVAEEEWLGDEQTGSTPLLLSLAVNADSLATWLLPALAPVLADSPIRLNLQVEDETRTQERLRRGEVVGAVVFNIRRCRVVLSINSVRSTICSSAQNRLPKNIFLTA